MIVALLLLAIGFLLSAFFSGTETGFYRASRVRWVLDALEGKRVAKLLLRFGNNPSLFVGTSLVGNNLANYLISLSIVLVAGKVFRESSTAEMLAPLLMTPVVFVYGELLPKNLFYLAPNRLLNRLGWIYGGFFLLFSPVVTVLWLIARLLERLLGQSPEKVRLTLARKELDQILREGEEAGILHVTQRRMAQNFFLIAAQPISLYARPAGQLPSLPVGTPIHRAIAYAHRLRLTGIVLYEGPRTNLVGYIRTVDLLLAKDVSAAVANPRELISVKATEHAGEVIMRMQTARADLARVLNAREQTIGVVALEDLTDPLIKPSANVS